MSREAICYIARQYVAENTPRQEDEHSRDRM